MKFKTYKEAKEYAKSETTRTKKKHVPVKTLYWSVDKNKEIRSYTVVLDMKKEKGIQI